MSCGCGGKGGVPVSVQLRMEAARLALMGDRDNFKDDAAIIYGFITEGVDEKDLDAPPAPVATGPGQDAVTSRNALLFAPCNQIHGLQPNGMLAGLRSNYGADNLGALVQLRQADIVEPAYRDEFQQLVQDLARYGLHLGMTTDDLRRWVLEGPQ